MKKIAVLSLIALAGMVSAAEKVCYSSDFAKTQAAGWAAQSKAWGPAMFSDSAPGGSPAVYAEGAEKQIYLIHPHLNFKIDDIEKTVVESEIYIDSETPPEYLVLSLTQDKAPFKTRFLFPPPREWINWKIPLSMLQNSEFKKIDPLKPVTQILFFSMKNKAASAGETARVYLRSLRIRTEDKTALAGPELSVLKIIDEWREFKEIKSDSAFSRPLVSEKTLPDNFILRGGSRIFSDKKHSAATKILKDNLLKMTKTDLECETADIGIPAVIIGGGRTAGLRNIDLSQAGEEGYLLDVSKERIIIAGKTDAGLLNGIYSFLDGLGMRWFMPGELGECAPDLGVPVSVKAAKKFVRPLFEVRYIWYAHGLWDKGYNSKTDMLKFEEFLARNKLKNSMEYVFHHSFSRMFPEEKYFKDHPEYFALIDGKRNPTSLKGQICVSNDDVLNITAEYIKDFFRKNPGMKGASLSTNDNPRSCECGKCREYYINNRKVTSKTYAYGCMEAADLQMAFMNKIYDKIKDEFQEKYLGSFILYDNIFRVPLKNKPCRNLAFEITTMPVCKFHPLDDPDCPVNREIYELFKEWAALGNPLIYRDYDPILWWKGLPSYNYRKTLDDLRMMIKQCKKPLGFNSEGARAWASNIPNYYIKARFAWNSDSDMEKVIDEFFLSFFGAAAALDMKNYAEFFQYLTLKSPIHPVAQDCDGAITALFPEKSLKILSSYIDGALSKTPKGSVFERRVRMMRMEFQYFTMYLEMLKEYNSENKEPGLNLIDRMVSHIKEMTRANPDFVSEKGVIKEIEKHRKYFDENRGFRKDKTVIDIPREWMFKPDPDNIGLEEKWFEKDSIRGDWGSVRIGNAWKNQGYDYKGTAWYKTTFKIPGEKRGRDIFLFVGALDISGDFYVNGKEVFKRKFVNPDDWKTAFEIDLSTCLRHGEENTFAIRVDGGGLGGVWKDMFLYWKNSQ